MSMAEVTRKKPQSDGKAPLIWTPSRKLLGNLIPFLVTLPIVALGLWRIFKGGATFGEMIVWLIVATAVLWIGVNFLGLFQNESIKKAMWRRLNSSLHEKEIPKDPLFVGFARPSYRSAIDPHEDVGFLLLHEDRIEFFGDKDRVELPKKSLIRATLRPNPHSWALLGGWVSVEGLVEGLPVRMLFEPRGKRTLLANRRMRKPLMERIQKWIDGGAAR